MDRKPAVKSQIRCARVRFLETTAMRATPAESLLGLAGLAAFCDKSLELGCSGAPRSGAVSEDIFWW